MLRNYSMLLLLVLLSSCSSLRGGRNESNIIANRSLAAFENRLPSHLDDPFQVNRFLVNVQPGNGGECSGILVGPKYVLTARHCSANPVSVIPIYSAMDSQKAKARVVESFDEVVLLKLDSITHFLTNEDFKNLQVPDVQELIEMGDLPDMYAYGIYGTVFGEQVCVVPCRNPEYNKEQNKIVCPVNLTNGGMSGGPIMRMVLDFSVTPPTQTIKILAVTNANEGILYKGARYFNRFYGSCTAPLAAKLKQLNLLER